MKKSRTRWSWLMVSAVAMAGPPMASGAEPRDNIVLEVPLAGAEQLSVPPLSIQPHPETGDPNWTCGDSPAVDAGPAEGKLNEALLGPVRDFTATLADGTVREISTLVVRFRSAASGVNELTVKRLPSHPDRIEWRLNAKKLERNAVRSICALPHELLQRLERKGDRIVSMQARLWDTGVMKRAMRATIEYESSSAPRSTGS